MQYQMYLGETLLANIELKEKKIYFSDVKTEKIIHTYLKKYLKIKEYTINKNSEGYIATPSEFEIKKMFLKGTLVI